MHEHRGGLPLIGVTACTFKERDGAHVVLGGHDDARLDVQRVPPTRRAPGRARARARLPLGRFKLTCFAQCHAAREVVLRAIPGAERRAVDRRRPHPRLTGAADVR